MTAFHKSLISRAFGPINLAEGVGFEPTEASASAVFKTTASPVFAGRCGKNQGALTAHAGRPAAGTPPSGSVDFLEAGVMTKVSSRSLRNPRSWLP